MHYYIDGYNLLFALFGPHMTDFASRRDWLIQSLNVKVEPLGLDISLVFDSHFCEGTGSRSHFHHLEILYTPKGVTADDFIIKKIKKSDDPTKILLVSNDRELTLRARNLLAGTQRVDEFTNWLDRRYKNKTQKKSKPISAFKLLPIEQKKQVENPQTPPLPEPQQPTEPTLAHIPGTMEYYLQHFESADEQFLIDLKAAKMKRKEEKKKRKRER